MTELSIDKLAQLIASKAKKLALEAEALAIIADEPGPARAALERIVESEQGISFWVEQLKKVAAK